MNTIVNITGITLKLSNVNVEKDMLFKKIKNKKKLDYIKNWRNKNKDKVRNYNQTWNLKNKEYKSKWFQKNKKNILEKKYLRLRTDLNFKIKHMLGTRIRKVLKGKIKKSKTTKQLVGCSIDKLWIHLEKQFKQGMTRENHGKWHIDHIKPCASFDLTKPEEQAKCFHYTNLQPLWASENLAKGSKISS